MSFLGVVKTHWLGTTGGPGLTQIAFRKPDESQITPGDAQQAVNAVNGFFVAIRGLLPNEISTTTDPVVDCFYYGATDNMLWSSNSASSAPASNSGTGTGSYSMAAGLRVNLNTGVIRYGRRINGSIFLVPLDSSAFSLTGTTNASAKTTIETAGTNLLAAMTSAQLVLGVWSRHSNKHHPERPSAFSDVQTIKVNDKTAILRGRRD